MREELKRSMVEDDDALIRDALKQMEVPVDRQRLRRAFLRRARAAAGAKIDPWPRWIGWAFSPQTATLGAVVYAMVVFLYLVAAVSNQPIVRVDGELGWVSGLRSSLGNPVLYEKRCELILKDGTKVGCIDPSVMAISFSVRERRIDLAKGTLEIETAHDLGRPLVVAVGDTKVKATGTRFVVSTKMTSSVDVAFGTKSVSTARDVAVGAPPRGCPGNDSGPKGNNSGQAQGPAPTRKISSPKLMRLGSGGS